MPNRPFFALSLAWLFLAFAPLTAGAQCAESQPPCGAQTRRGSRFNIVGGAETGFFRDCVAIGQKRDLFCCTGTLVSPDVVVSAGHCAECSAWVFVGDDVSKPKSRDEFIGVKAHIVHPGFVFNEDTSEVRDDIAVLILERPVPPGARACPRPMASAAEIEAAAAALAVGYGHDDKDATSGYGVRRCVELPIIQGRIERYAYRPSLEIAAGEPSSGRDACAGDSGGPLYVRGLDGTWKVAGATSRTGLDWKTRCGDGGVYTRLDAYAEWIREVAAKNGAIPPDLPVQGDPSPEPALEAGSLGVLSINGAPWMDFSWIPAGEFAMGSPASEPGSGSDEGPRTRVALSGGFWLGQTEVTQEQWAFVMGTDLLQQREQAGGAFLSLAGEGPDHPMYYVTWGEAREFCRRLSATAGVRFDLPTEAQWEYACRAGSAGRYAFGSEISRSRACFGSDGTVPVGGFAPNAWNLYDMHGNVAEWCLDWRGAYPGGSVRDWAGPRSGSRRAFRGGSWEDGPDYLRSADRGQASPDTRSTTIGFRVACYP